MDDYWRETESLGKYSNISAKDMDTQIFPSPKLCVTPLWRRNRGDDIELANYGIFEKGNK